MRCIRARRGRHLCGKGKIIYSHSNWEFPKSYAVILNGYDKISSQLIRKLIK